MMIWEGLGVRSTVVQHCRQPRDSMECGLHVCMLGPLLKRRRSPIRTRNVIDENFEGKSRHISDSANVVTATRRSEWRLR